MQYPRIANIYRTRIDMREINNDIQGMFFLDDLRIFDHRESDYEGWTCDKIPHQYISFHYHYFFTSYSIPLPRGTLSFVTSGMLLSIREEDAKSRGKTSRTILGNLPR
jgi:hypothetical protein